MRMDVAMDPLPRLVRDLGEHQAADAAPAADPAVREIPRRLRVVHRYWELCRPSIGGCI